MKFVRGPDNVFIDGRAAGEISGEWLAPLAPGEHLLRVGTYWPTWRIDFEPGHVYVLDTDYVNVPDRRAYLWVENTTTGEIVAGDPPSDRTELIQRSDAVRDRRLTRQRFEKTLRDASCGDVLAQNRVGLLYLAGLEPLEQPDLVQAYVWYGMAGARGDAAAESVSKRIAAELSPGQMESARHASAEASVTDCPKGGGTR